MCALLLFYRIYVEIERARLTRTLAKIREDEGDINTAASVPDALNIVTEYADGGSLDGLLKRNQGQLEEFLIALWLAQLILAARQRGQSSILSATCRLAPLLTMQSWCPRRGPAWQW